VLNAENKPNLLEAGLALNSQWGTPVPQEFIGHASP